MNSLHPSLRLLQWLYWDTREPQASVPFSHDWTKPRWLYLQAPHGQGGTGWERMQKRNSFLPEPFWPPTLSVVWKVILRLTRPSPCGSHCLEGRFTSSHTNIQLPVSFKAQGHTLLPLVTGVAIPTKCSQRTSFSSLQPTPTPIHKLCQLSAASHRLQGRAFQERLGTQREMKRKNRGQGWNTSRNIQAPWWSNFLWAHDLK